MRDEIRAGLNEALKSQDKLRASTMRLISAAIKDRDIEARGQGKDQISDEEILALLQKMVKQREESAKIYRENDRDELADQELAEIEIIQKFLPRTLSDDEVQAAIAEVIGALDATGMQDMGRVIGELKQRHPGQLDMGKVSGAVKVALSG